MYAAHRINTVAELQKIPTYYGIELDLRDNTEGQIYMEHDPFKGGELFSEFLQHYQHRFIILNIKSEGIEPKVQSLLQEHGIVDYFFLDSSFPMMIKLARSGEHHVAVRFSEYESLDSVLRLKGLVSWVWVDCFSIFPLTPEVYSTLIEAGFKICIVSPELQKQDSLLEVYRDYMRTHAILPDMVCTKVYNIPRWRPELQVVVPMSGLGQRFVDAGYTVPKPLIVVDGKPMIQHVVELFPGEEQHLFICNLDHTVAHPVQELLRTISPRCNIVTCSKRDGPVDALLYAQDHISDESEVIVSYCDYGTRYDYDAFLLDARRSGADGSVAGYTGFHPHMLGKDHYAYVRTDTDGWLQEIREKTPFSDNKMAEFASNGTYYFRTGRILKKYCNELIRRGIRVKGEYYVSLLYNLMHEDGLRTRTFRIQNMLQWGTPFDLECYARWSSYFREGRGSQPQGSIPFQGAMIVPLAGRGSRFNKYDLPKPLLPVDGAPMVLASTRDLPEASRYVYVCLEEHVREHAVDKIILNARPRAEVISIPQVTEGQACTCEIAIRSAGLSPDEPIMITACDNTCLYDAAQLQQWLSDTTVDVIVFAFKGHPSSRNNPNMYAWLETDADGTLRRVSCKNFSPERHNLEQSYVIEGTMYFRKALYFLDGLEHNRRNKIRTNGEYYVDDVLNVNVRSGLRVKVLPLTDYICWGTPDDYETYNYWKGYHMR